MPSQFPVSPLPFPPATYEQRYFNEVIRTLNLYFRQIENPGAIYGTKLTLTASPTSTTNLRDGDVWTDLSDGGTLKLYDSTPTSPILVVTASTALTTSYSTALVTVSGQTVTLPAASTQNLGRTWTVILAVAGTVDIICTGADTFILPVASSTITLNTKGSSVSLRCVTTSSFGIV